MLCAHLCVKAQRIPVPYVQDSDSFLHHNKVNKIRKT